MVFNYKNIFKDYLDYTIKKLEKRKCNFLYSTKDDKAFFSDGHIAAIIPKEWSPFAENDNSIDFEKMLYKYQDKKVYISTELIIINGIECYVIKDDFDNAITYLNRKMFDRWFDKNSVSLYMQNLDNKTPVFIWYTDTIVGLQLPIRKVI